MEDEHTNSEMANDKARKAQIQVSYENGCSEEYVRDGYQQQSLMEICFTSLLPVFSKILIISFAS